MWGKEVFEFLWPNSWPPWSFLQRYNRTPVPRRRHFGSTSAPAHNTEVNQSHKIKKTNVRTIDRNLYVKGWLGIQRAQSREEKKVPYRSWPAVSQIWSVSLTLSITLVSKGRFENSKIAIEKQKKGSYIFLIMNDAPIVECWFGKNVPSTYLKTKHVFPTPEMGKFR